MKEEWTYTQWYISLIANSLAITISTIIGLLYAQYKHKHNQKNQDDYEDFTLSDWFTTFIISFFSAFIIYLFIFTIFGYVPMGKVNKGLINL